MTVQGKKKKKKGIMSYTNCDCSSIYSTLSSYFVVGEHDQNAQGELGFRCLRMTQEPYSWGAHYVFQSTLLLLVSFKIVFACRFTQ